MGYGAVGWQPNPTGTELSARRLVAELFDIRPQVSPLSEDLPGDW